MNAPESPEPYIPPPPETPGRDVLALPWSAPLHWLTLGLKDLRAEPAIGLFFGICFVAMAWLLGLVFRNKPEYTLSMVSGCLLVGPFLAMGLYHVSKIRELGDKPSLPGALTCWYSHVRSMGMLVLVMIVLELLWVRASLVVFAVFFNTGMPSTSSVLQAVFNPQNIEFLVVYVIVGSAFAALVFATSVVSIPMILDRDTDAISAAITSIQVVVENTGVLILWGLLIAMLVLLALLPWGLGLLLVGPWLGHASWHAYRGSVRWPQAQGT